MPACAANNTVCGSKHQCSCMPDTRCSSRKIPVTAYANYGTVCTPDNLIIGATVNWEGGSYAGVLQFYGPNMRHTGFTVEVKEGSIVAAQGSGTCCCKPGTTDTVDYDYVSEDIEIKGSVFSKPHYYIVFYMEEVLYYWE